MPQCDKHPGRALVRCSRRRQRERATDCIANCPRYARRTPNDSPQIERKAPAGIAVDPQAAGEMRTLTGGSTQAQHWHRHGGGGFGPGFVGGLAAGAVIGGGYYGGGYYGGPYAYGGGPYAYGGGCYIERQVVINRFGQRVIRRVRVCD